MNQNICFENDHSTFAILRTIHSTKQINKHVNEKSLNGFILIHVWVHRWNARKFSWSACDAISFVPQTIICRIDSRQRFISFKWKNSTKELYLKVYPEIIDSTSIKRTRCSLWDNITLFIQLSNWHSPDWSIQKKVWILHWMKVSVHELITIQICSRHDWLHR